MLPIIVVVIGFLSVIEKSIESNDFSIIKTLGENYASRFWTSMLRYWMPCNQKIFWSEFFFICYSQKMMSKTCSSFLTEVTFQFLSAISARSLIHSPDVLKTKPTASVFWFCLSAQYTWADRVHMIRC